MSHLTDEGFVDVLFGRADARALAHLRGCDSCAGRLAEAEAGLAATRGDEVPEPGPLYWEALRRNVRRRVAEEPKSSGGIAWLVPIAAAAALSAVVIGRPAVRSPLPLASPTAAAAVVAAWSALPPIEDDEAVPVLDGVLAMVGPGGWDEGRGADAYVAGLTEDESAALARETLAAPDKGEDL